MKEYIRNDTPKRGSGVAQNEIARKILGCWCKGGTVRGRVRATGCPTPVVRLEWHKNNASVLKELGRQIGIRNIGPLTLTQPFQKIL
jgi:hypothetical protein